MTRLAAHVTLLLAFAGCTACGPEPDRTVAVRTDASISTTTSTFDVDAQYAVDRIPTTTRPSRSRPRPTPPTTRVPSATSDLWHALAMCESGMRQQIVGEGVHYSYFQWKLATWRSVKAPGDPDDPRDASYDAQVAAAKRLQARSGWGQWPACSRKLGLR